MPATRIAPDPIAATPERQRTPAQNCGPASRATPMGRPVGGTLATGCGGQCGTRDAGGGGDANEHRRPAELPARHDMSLLARFVERLAGIRFRIDSGLQVQDLEGSRRTAGAPGAASATPGS